MGYKLELEALILGALRNGPLHGYRISAEIKATSEGALKMGDNQIYPTLHRLEAEQLVVSEWQDQPGKPARKVYALTPEGTARLERHQREWVSYADKFSAVLGLAGGANA